MHLKGSQVQIVWTTCPKKESGRSFNSNSSWELQVSQNLEEWFGIGIWSIFSKLYAQTTFFFPYMFHYITVRYCGYDYEVAAATVGDSEPAATSCCSSEPPCPWCELSADFIALLVLSCWTSDLNSLESLDDDFKSQAELSWPCFSHGCFTRKLYVRQPLLNKSNWCHELIQIILHTYAAFLAITDHDCARTIYVMKKKIVRQSVFESKPWVLVPYGVPRLVDQGLEGHH